MLFLHGNGERGDGKAELDYVLTHGPLYEAWIQKRNLPFIIVSPQLPMFGQGEVDYIKNRTPAQIPRRRPDGVDARPDERLLRAPAPMPSRPPEDQLPTGPEGPVDGWNLIADELIRVLDATVRDFRGDARRLYLTGLSYGGFGSWFLAAQHPGKFAALAPVVGYGHPEHAAPIARAKLPVWCFAGGLDPVVEARYFQAGGAGPRGRAPHQSRRAGTFHLGARLRRRGSLHLDARALPLTASSSAKKAADSFEPAAQSTIRSFRAIPP
jgi:pimeloyl-ACP methyl ester carboxylesterase